MTTAHMNTKTVALCHAYRNPPAGVKRMTYDEICIKVKKTDGTHPSKSSVYEALRALKYVTTTMTDDELSSRCEWW